MDRRAIFCLVAASLCALLVPVTPAGYRWVGITLTLVYLLMAGASYLDFRHRTRARR